MISQNSNNNETLIGENIMKNNEINNIHNNKLETNYNINSFNEPKKLTDIEKCINELKNQISNVRNCLKYEETNYNNLCDLGNKFQSEILGIKDFKNKLNLYVNGNYNNYNQLWLNSVISQNQMYQNYQNQIQNYANETINQNLNANDINNKDQIKISGVGDRNNDIIFILKINLTKFYIFWGY